MGNTLDTITLTHTLDVEKKLKTTAWSSVFLVRDSETRKRYIYRQFTGDGEVYRRLCSLTCPYLPRIYFVHEENQQVSVLEEYVQGDNLAFLLEARPFPLEQMVNIALQICEALEALHSIGAVHRDIKPENIIIRGSKAVLIDFDASRVPKEDNLQDTRIMGTTGYAAPEQYGFSQTDARSDIYSMGILMNEMLTKKHPSKQLAKGKLQPVIERCIEVNVDKRYPSAAQLAADITRRHSGRSGKRAAFAALLAAVLCLGFFGFLHKSAAGDAAGDFQPEPVAVSAIPWDGPANAYEMPFSYDLDGDGVTENYRFGLYHMNIPDAYSMALYDNFSLAESDTSYRNVYPCVWQSNADGTATRVEELNALLTDMEIQLWPAPGNTSPAPVVYTSEGPFSTGIQVTFTADNVGIWLYDVHAKLGDLELTAMGQSMLDILQY